MFRANCPKCNTACLVNDQQLNSTVACGQCGFVFTVRAKPPAAAVSVPQAVAAGAPAASAASDDDEDILPSWDENEVAAKLAGVQTPAATPAPPASPAAPAALPAAQPVPAAAPAAPAPPLPTPVIRLEIGAATSSGRVRNRNEDSYAIHQLRWSNKNQGHDVALVVVADGMGGYDAGDVASGLAIQAVVSSMAASVSQAISAQAPPANLGQPLDAAIRAANQQVHRKASTDPQCKGMGTTLAAVSIWDGNAAIAHVGDCRVYHFRGGLKQVTEDQTLLQRMLQLGQITAQEAANPNHPARSEVAQAVGRQPDVTPSAQQLRLAAGDWLIIACDGLHAHVDAKALENAIRSASAAGALALQLVNLANQGGGTDNITVVAIRCY